MKQSPIQKMLSRFLVDHSEDASLFLMGKDSSQIRALLSQIPSVHLGPCLRLLPAPVLGAALDEADEGIRNEILLQFSPGLVAAIFRFWITRKKKKPEEIEKILSQLSPEKIKAVRLLLAYSEDTVGSIMNPAPFTVRDTMSVQDVLQLFKGKKERYGRYIYVLDESSVLKGVVPFKEIFFGSKAALISELMTSEVFAFSPDQGRKNILVHSVWKKWDLIPVVDTKSRFLGVVRYEDLEEGLDQVGPQNAERSELLKAGTAVGEVLQIAVSGTISAFGLDSRK